MATPMLGISRSYKPGAAMYVLVSWCPGVLVSWCPGVLASWRELSLFRRFLSPLFKLFLLVSHKVSGITQGLQQVGPH